MTLTCARKQCDVEFGRKTHNQIYCSDECCRLATNARIMENYYEDKDRKNGKTRMCASCDKTKLSRYNSSPVCAACTSTREKNANNSVLDMLNTVSFA